MSPFREPPPIVLGPLATGLDGAAARALARLPSGGRLLVARPARLAAHTAGALGTAGLLAVLGLGVVACSGSWQPSSVTDVLLCVAGVFAGGSSLAAVFRATDHAASRPARRGELVGRAARATLLRMGRLAVEAERAPIDFGARRIAALRAALGTASDADLAAWIPADVRGRAELLLARAIAAFAGPKLASHARCRAEVRRLLVEAAEHLGDAAPAAADLATLDGHAARKPRVRFDLEASPAELAASDALEEEHDALPAALRRLSAPSR